MHQIHTSCRKDGTLNAIAKVREVARRALMDSKQDTVQKILHKIKNLFGPIQIFLDLVETNHNDAKLQNLHQNCKENLRQVQQLLEKF